jgi:predicted SAM-dependent methyltransferase
MFKIDLGCGRSKRGDDWFGIDCQALPGVDLVCDCNERIPLDDNCADEIAAYDFLEHVRNDRRIHIMHEIWRLLKPGGVLTSSTPSSDGRGAYQDPTHYAFWNENSFYYYTNDDYRALYGIIPKFDVILLHTTDMTPDRICWVNATMMAVK